MNPVYDKLLKCYESVKQKIDFQPEVAIVLGSGLGDYADDIRVEAELDYHDIEGFPVSTVPGHAGKFIFGYVGGVPVVCMKGRVHYYEGYPISDVVLPTRLMKLMGAKVLFLTNASGGINPSFTAGDFMMLTDHVSLWAPNPLIGANPDELGEQGISLKEGIYAQLTGPSFESPAEIRLLHKLDVDAVGMSTVVEAIAANHMGMKICCISCVCNLAAGMTDNPLTHEEVQEAANAAAPAFKTLVTESVKKFGAALKG